VEEALRAEQRLTRTLIEAVEVLARELENRLRAGRLHGAPERPALGAEMARLSRRVARQLSMERRAADVVGVAAQLYALARLIRDVDEEAAASDLFGELGWVAAGSEGLLPILRALTSASAGFGQKSGTPPLGARIIAVVTDYLELGVAAGEADLGTVSQLLRASTGGAAVVDALLKVLEAPPGGDAAPGTTVTATSVLNPPSDPPAEVPVEVSEEPTVRKAIPVARERAPRREPKSKE
jgi:hypothetical protein